MTESDSVDAEKLARFARLDPNILRPITHRSVALQESLTIIQGCDVLVRLRTALANATRGLAKRCALVQVPGVGALTAVTFVLTVGDKHLFQKSRDVGSYIGLRPRRDQSGSRSFLHLNPKAA